MRVALVVALTVVAAAVSSPAVDAQTSVPAFASPVVKPAAPMLFGVTPKRRDPALRLFMPAQKPTPSPADLPVWTERPVVMTTTSASVACGMNLVTGDAKVDPLMPHPAPERAGQAAIRTIPAPPCVK